MSYHYVLSGISVTLDLLFCILVFFMCGPAVVGLQINVFLFVFFSLFALQPTRRQSLTAPSPNTISWEEYISADNGKYVSKKIEDNLFRQLQRNQSRLLWGTNVNPQTSIIFVNEGTKCLTVLSNEALIQFSSVKEWKVRL